MKEHEKRGKKERERESMSFLERKKLKEWGHELDLDSSFWI